jgi:membrane-associated phospholipid phosphatase
VVAILLGLFWRYQASLLILLAGIIVMPYAWVLKDQFAVTRPLNWLGDMGLRDQLVVVPHVELASGFTSFPSGHTIAAFTLYSLLALILSGIRPIYGFFCAFFAILVGFSRIFLAQHFLTDVLGGVVFGLILGSLVWQIGKWKVLQKNAALDGNLLQSFRK